MVKARVIAGDSQYESRSREAYWCEGGRRNAGRIAVRPRCSFLELPGTARTYCRLRQC